MKLLPLLLLCPSVALANPPPGGGNPAWHDWFENQEMPDGSHRSCCREGDGHILSDDQWRIADGEYEVWIEDQWVRFPNKGQGKPGNTVMGYTANPTGSPVAWWHSPSVIYCFAPGTVS